MRLPELIALLCQAWLLSSRAALIERRGRVIVGLAQHIAACRAMSLSQGSASGDAADVRFGSLADEGVEATRSSMSALPPKADITAGLSESPLSAKSGLTNPSKTPLYSSVRAATNCPSAPRWCGDTVVAACLRILLIHRA